MEIVLLAALALAPFEPPVVTVPGEPKQHSHCAGPIERWRYRRMLKHPAPAPRFDPLRGSHRK